MENEQDTASSFPPVLEWHYYWISRVNAQYTVVLEDKLKPHGINLSRWRVLSSLHQYGSLGVSEIANLAILRLNTATKVVQKMTTEGLVQTQINAQDARITQVVLTEKGRLQAIFAEGVAASIFEASFNDISKSDRERLNKILGRVAQKLTSMSSGEDV